MKPQGFKDLSGSKALFGRKVEWHAWSRKGHDDGGLKFLEVIEPYNREHPEMQVHVFMSATADADLEPLKKLAEALAIP